VHVVESSLKLMA